MDIRPTGEGEDFIVKVSDHGRRDAVRQRARRRHCDVAPDPAAAA
jgi:hypothetical protein